MIRVHQTHRRIVDVVASAETPFNSNTRKRPARRSSTDAARKIKSPIKKPGCDWATASIVKPQLLSFEPRPVQENGAAAM